MALISIIVPVYNTAPYLARCLDSIIGQSFRDIEIICVNDGSADNSADILSYYAGKDNRIIIITQDNRGLSAARNAGLCRATGDFIQFCDSDDYFDASMCEAMSEALVSSRADIAVAGIRLVYDGISKDSDIEYYCDIKQKGLYSITDKTFANTNVYAWNKIYKRSLIEAYTIKFPDGLLYEDAAFVFKYLYVSKSIYYLREKLYYYVRHQGTIMSLTINRKNKEAIHHLYIIQDITYFVGTYGFSEKYPAAFLWMILTYTRLACLYGSSYRESFMLARELIDNSDKRVIAANGLSFFNKFYFSSLKNAFYAGYYVLNIIQAGYNGAKSRIKGCCHSHKQSFFENGKIRK
jgi:glycosyltransferase involved in cell wall biosynthesis